MDVIAGLEIRDSITCTPRGKTLADLIARDGTRVPLTEDVLSRHVLYAGATGSGKTTAINQLLSQIISGMGANDTMVVFDTKGDFRKRFYRSGRDVVISNDDTSTDYWNIFDEAMIDGDDRVEENMLEIASNLFSDKIRRSSSPFFPQAAKDVFFGLLMYLYKANIDATPENLNNQELYYFIRDAHMDEVVRALGSHTSLRGIIDYIYSGDAEVSEQSQGVYSELRLIANELFRRNFRREGHFSARSFVRNRGGRILFIEYDVSSGTILTPLYRCIYDLAIKEALSRTDASAKGNCYFVIDEFKLLPSLEHIDDGVNFGRSQGAKFIVAIQNINQIVEAYGREKAYSILSAFGTSVTFRLTDRESIRFIQGRYGRNRKRYVVPSASYTERDREDIGYGEAVEDWEVLNLFPGEAIVSVATYSPYPFRFTFKE